MRWTYVLLGITVLVASAAPVAAQADVTQLIPDDAVGFVVVNRVSQTNEKATAFAKRLKIDVPGNPLEMLKGALGVEKGLNEKGTVAIAAFLAKNETDEPRPLLYVPVTDYQAFIDQLQPRAPKEGVTEVKLKDGKAMVAGKRGNYAVLAQTEDVELLIRALKTEKTLGAWGEPLAAWLADNDGAGVVTVPGIQKLTKEMRRGLDEAKQNLANLPPEAQFVTKLFDNIDSCIKSAATDITHAGFGVKVDATGNLHLSAKALFKKDSGFAKAGGKLKAPPGGALAGLPSGPFVLALGASMPEDFMKAMVDINMDVLKASGQNIPAETLKKVEDVYAKMMKGMGNMGFVWQVGKEKTPLFANMSMVMHTPDTATYLADYEKSLKVMNELAKELNIPTLPSYEIKKTKVSGKDALEASMDFTGAFGGLPEEVQGIMKSMFGPDGKMTISIAARDDKTIVMRYTGAAGLKEMLDGEGKGLLADAGVMQVSKALPSGSQWVIYLSPQGATEFADRTIKAVLPIPIQVPQFPATPPIGIAARVNAEGFEMHTVVPAGVLDNARNFVDQLKMLFGGGA